MELLLEVPLVELLLVDEEEDEQAARPRRVMKASDPRAGPKVCARERCNEVVTKLLDLRRLEAHTSAASVSAGEDVGRTSDSSDAR